MIPIISRFAVASGLSQEMPSQNVERLPNAPGHAATTMTTYVSEKVPLTKAFVNDDFPTARKPKIATLRWTRAGSLFAVCSMILEGI